jgi:anti-sigma B factor antagonist
VKRSRTDPSPTRPEIDAETIDAGVAVHVNGELDLATVGDLEERIERALSESSGALLIDFTDCGFIDSSVLSLLVKLHRRLGDSIRPCLAVVARDQPLQVLRLTQLDCEMPVFASLGEALTALQGGDAASRL